MGATHSSTHIFPVVEAAVARGRLDTIAARQPPPTNAITGTGALADPWAEGDEP